MDFFHFNFISTSFQYHFNFNSISVQSQYNLNSFFYSITVTFLISSKFLFFSIAYVGTTLLARSWVWKKIENFQTVDGKRLLHFPYGAFDCKFQTPCYYYTASVIALFVPSLLFIIYWFCIITPSDICGCLSVILLGVGGYALWPVRKLLGNYILSFVLFIG